ncbi:alpha/beta-Hydrolases superfamily protein [Zea mays]|uniref:Alpha/beta-Hydrolases superfamily protein n=1 Tax=Zea mays TaxID=4577 RepID=A0A1D6PYR3_MAIZE|nr:alpha/beta-Hydrolases superfamily protein [Zea mays]
MVHHRFYSAYDNTTLLYEILKSIKWARKTYGNLPVNVVGHSIGGDLASFCVLGLFVHIYLSILDTYFLCVFHIICVFLKKWVYGMSVADHLEYYSVTLHADSRGTCQFVIGTTNQVYNYIREVDGSIILLRYICKNHEL